MKIYDDNLLLMEPLSEGTQQDVRWRQRLSNYKKAFAQLEKFIEKEDLNELEEQGLIKAFEYTFELAWNVIKDYYTFQGAAAMQGSRDAIRLAFNRGLIEDGEGWMDMVDGRIKSAHTYEKESVKEIVADIFHTYYYLFDDLLEKMKTLSGE